MSSEESPAAPSSEPPVGTLPPGTKACNLCCAAIPERANYCRVCETYQSGFRKVLSGFKLSELTTLISTGALAFTFVGSHFTEHKAEIGFAPLGCSDSSFKIIALNEGTRAGIVQRAVVTRTLNGSADPRGPVDFEHVGDDAALFPGKERTLAFQVKTGAIGFPTAPSSVKTCYTVEVWTVEFTGHTQSGRNPCSCV